VRHDGLKATLRLGEGRVVGGRPDGAQRDMSFARQRGSPTVTSGQSRGDQEGPLVDYGT